MAATPFLNEAELHGLVDGQVEASRRAELLRRAAASAVDRERIESWQEQADMIRVAFRGVEREQMPAVLDLRPPTRLQCVPDARAANSNLGPKRGRPQQNRNLVGFAAALAVACLMVIVCWSGGLMAPGPHATSAVRGPWVVGSLGERPTVTTSAPTRASPMPPVAIAMPATTIPDLTFAGFTFRSAETRLEPRLALILRYGDALAEKLDVTITKAAADADAAADARAENLVWRNGTARYAVSGSLGRERLRAIAAALRDELQDE